MRTFVVVDHPGFYLALEKIRDEQRRTEFEICRIEHGFRLHRTRRFIRERTTQIQTIMNDYGK